MGEFGPMVGLGVVVAIVVGALIAVAVRADARRTPEDRAQDSWKTQADLLTQGYKDAGALEATIRHYKEPGDREEWRIKLVTFRALVDAGLSIEGALLNTIGSPDDPTYREGLGERGEEVVAKAIADYHESKGARGHWKVD